MSIKPGPDPATAYRQEWWNHELGWASKAHRQTYITMLQNNLGTCLRLSSILETRIQHLRAALSSEGVSSP